jgi:hypothetical protein
LPGPEPGDFDIGVLRQLLVEEQLPPSAAAGRMGTTISHVRLAAEYIARPAPQYSPRGGRPQGIDVNQVCARCQRNRNTIYPILTRLTSARWVSRKPENPQSRRDRAGPGKGGPPYMRYHLTADGLAAAALELADRTDMDRPPRPDHYRSLAEIQARSDKPTKAYTAR